MKEKKARVEDALHATRAAVEEGILPGGGTALLRSLAVLGGVKTSSHDEATGVEIIRRALQEPTRCIAGNAGEEGAVVVKKVLAGKGNFGFNALTLNYEPDMVKAGIITPTKVERSGPLRTLRAWRHCCSPRTLLLLKSRSRRMPVALRVAAWMAWAVWVAWGVWVEWVEWAA